MNKKNAKKIELRPIINSANHQINFSLKKRLLSNEIRLKLPKLKSIKLRMEDFEFE